MNSCQEQNHSLCHGPGRRDVNWVGGAWNVCCLYLYIFSSKWLMPVLCKGSHSRVSHALCDLFVTAVLCQLCVSFLSVHYHSNSISYTQQHSACASWDSSFMSLFVGWNSFLTIVPRQHHQSTPRHPPIEFHSPANENLSWLVHCFHVVIYHPFTSGRLSTDSVLYSQNFLKGLTAKIWFLEWEIPAGNIYDLQPQRFL